MSTVHGPDARTAPSAVRHLVVVSGGVGQPSSTRLLADRMTGSAVASLAVVGLTAQVEVVDVRDLARDQTSMVLTGVPTPRLGEAFGVVAAADAVLLVTPIYSGSYPGMVKDFLDLLPPDALRGLPVLMGATAGTARHALALEHAVRPLLSHLGALVVPTGVFAATEDFGEVTGSTTADEVPLSVRISRAGTELAELVAQRAPRSPAADPFALTASFEELLRGQ